MSLINKPITDGRYRVVDPSTTFLVVLILVIAGGPAAVGATPHFVYTRCIETAGSYTPQSLFLSNLNSLLSDLLVNSSLQSSYSNSIGDFPDDVVHGLFYCRGDVAPAECGSCAQAAAARVVLDCPSEKEAVIWYEECTLRYSASQVDDVENVWASQQAPATNTISVPADVYGRLFDGLVKEASYSNNLDNSPIRYFQTGKTTLTSTVSLGGLVQCAPQMSESQCEGCLRASVGVIPLCCGWQREWVIVVRPSCLVEYRYYDDVVDPAHQYSSSSSSGGSGSLLPDAHSTWGNIKFYLTLAFGISITITVSITLSYTCVAKFKHEFDLSPKRPSKQPDPDPDPDPDSKPGKPEVEPTEATKPKCKEPIIKCPTHKCGCGSCNITDDGRVVLVPIPPHCGGYPSTNFQGYPPYSGFPPSQCGGSSFSRCEY